MMTYGKTWCEPEENAYHQSFGRKAFVRVCPNSHAPSFPAELIGSYRKVRASIPDTFFTIPARLRYKGKRFVGFLSMDTDNEELTFTPEAEIGHCDRCTGCRTDSAAIGDLAMRIQLAVANVPQAAVVLAVKPAMLGGTALAGTGFSQEWPDEPTTLVVGTVDGEPGLTSLQAAVGRLLAEHGETAAWLDVDGQQGRLVYASKASKVA